ncbi:MAG: dTDP-glucose pyrophosphorylase [uncultured Acidilobus sp. JCHS]|nr:MAG: dTDP-glucose pyrophosphorylase [uncultured Acidilobus sp. JCHS]
MEGVIITGGKGTRMRNITYVLPKPLLPLFSFNSDGRRYVKPFIDFILERFEALGLDPVTLVFSRNSSLIIDYLGSRGPLRLRLRLVLDAEMRGYGNAALLARSSVTGPFVLNADDTCCRWRTTGRASSSSRQRDLTPCSSCTGSRTQRGTAS